MADVGIKIKVDGGAAFRQEIAGCVQKSKELASELKMVTSGFDNTTSAQEKARKKYEVVSKQIENQTKYIDTLTKKQESQKENLAAIADELEKAKREYGENSKEVQELTKKYDAQKNAISNTQTQINNATTALNKMKQEQKQLASEMDKTKTWKDRFEDLKKKVKEAGDKLQAVGDTMKKVGEGMTKYVTGPIAAVGTATVAAWKSVDEAYDTVIKKTGATGDELDGLLKTVDNIATTIPADFGEIGEAVGEVNSRFGSTGKELEDLTSQFVKFAQINDTSVSSSIDNVQSAMAAWGVESKDAGKMLDTLNKVGQKTGANVDKLSQDLVTNSAVFKEMGFSVADAANFLGVLDVQGLDTAGVMAGLKKALAEATKEGKTMPEALTALQTALSTTADPTERMNLAVELFGQKNAPAMLKALDEGRISFEALGTSIEDNLGSVSDTFDATLDPIDEWKLTLNQLKLTGAQLGTTLGKVLQPVLEKVGAVVKKVADWWEGLDEKHKKMIVTIALVVAAIGPIVSVIGAVISGIGVLTTVIPLLLSPIAGVVAAVAAVIAIVTTVTVLVVKNWDKIKAAVQSGVAAVKNWISNLVDTVKTKFDNIKNKITNVWNVIKQTASIAWNGIKTAIITPVENVWKKVQEIIGKIKSLFSGTISFPKIKMPHFEWSYTEVLGVKIPKFRVNWYDKGGIFDRPSVIGVGEKRPEFVGALDDLRKIVREESHGTININVYGAEGQSEEVLADIVMHRMEHEMNRRELAYV